MNKTISMILSILLMLTMVPAACAAKQNAVLELYSADRYYEDSVGNGMTYSYHVPQINADTPAAKEINTEIAENFGERV